MTSEAMPQRSSPTERGVIPMSTTQRAKRKTGRFRWTAEQFQKAAEEGWFADRKVELLDGDVYYMVRNPLHRNCVWKLHELFSALLEKARWTITREDDVEMGDDWVPSPDVAVIRGGFDLLKDHLLKGTDVALLVEVSHKTYTRDRRSKLPRYAHNKIPVYWIVSIEQRTVEVFTNPVGQGDLATYAATPLIYHEGDSIPVELDGSVLGHLSVSEIFS
jgi:Uma2 family endonuclease